MFDCSLSIVCRFMIWAGQELPSPMYRSLLVSYFCCAPLELAPLFCALPINPSLYLACVTLFSSCCLVVSTRPGVSGPPLFVFLVPMRLAFGETWSSKKSS